MIIDIKGVTKTYTKHFPVGYRPIGTIDEAGNGPGALAVNIISGQYVQVNFEQVYGHPLDQYEVGVQIAAAIEREGGQQAQTIRPSIANGRKSMYSVNLNQSDADELRAYGDGNLSLGVRMALAAVKLQG